MVVSCVTSLSVTTAGPALPGDPPNGQALFLFFANDRSPNQLLSLPMVRNGNILTFAVFVDLLHQFLMVFLLLHQMQPGFRIFKSDNCQLRILWSKH